MSPENDNRVHGMSPVYIFLLFIGYMRYTIGLYKTMSYEYSPGYIKYTTPIQAISPYRSIVLNIIKRRNNN